MICSSRPQPEQLNKLKLLDTKTISKPKSFNSWICRQALSNKNIKIYVVLAALSEAELQKFKAKLESDLFLIL